MPEEIGLFRWIIEGIFAEQTHNNAIFIKKAGVFTFGEEKGLGNACTPFGPFWEIRVLEILFQLQR